MSRAPTVAAIVAGTDGAAVSALRLATYADMHALTRLPIGTLRSMVSRGTIPHVRVSPRIVLFDLDVIEAWLRERAVAVSR